MEDGEEGGYIMRVGKGEGKKRRSEVQVPFLVAVSLSFFHVLCLKEEPSPQRAKSVLTLIVNMTMSDSFLLYWLMYLLP